MRSLRQTLTSRSKDSNERRLNPHRPAYALSRSCIAHSTSILRLDASVSLCAETKFPQSCETADLSPPQHPTTRSRFGRLEIQSRSPERPLPVRRGGPLFVRARGSDERRRVRSLRYCDSRRAFDPIVLAAGVALTFAKPIRRQDDAA